METNNFDINKEYEIINYYEELKNTLKKVKLIGYEEYDLGNLLGSEIHKYLLLNKVERAKRLISYILCEKSYIINKKNTGSNSSFGYVLDMPSIRKDNETIIDNAISFLDNPNIIELHRSNRIKISKVFGNIVYWNKSIFLLKEIKAIRKKIYFASLMVMTKNVLKSLIDNEIIMSSKIFMVFQDHEFLANTMVQTVKINNGITITLQHGQNFYRRLFADHVGIENFTCDYRLLWNEYTKVQFMKAGFESKRLPVVGSTKYANTVINKLKLKTSIVVKKNITFGIVLDTPTYSFTDETNIYLIECAKMIHEKYGFNFIIKCHPVDKRDRYSEYIKETGCIEITDRNMQMDTFCSKIDFALSCGTGAIVDLYIYDIQVFILKSYIPVPIKTNDIYEFADKTELRKKIEIWYNNIVEYTMEFKEIRAMYYEENIWKKHKTFFEKVKKDAVNINLVR